MKGSFLNSTQNAELIMGRLKSAMCVTTRNCACGRAEMEVIYSCSVFIVAVQVIQSIEHGILMALLCLRHFSDVVCFDS